MTDDATRPIETPADIAAPAEPPMAAAIPVAATPMAATAPGGGRGRWIVAGVIAALAIGAAIGAVLLFGQQSSPVALQYIPGNAVVVAELRLDLPGDQMQHLGNLLAHFPGFADPSTLGTKLDEALSKLVASSGETDVSYQADIKPWLAGPAFLGVLSLPTSTAEATPSDVLLSVTTNGTAACTALFKNETVTHEAYKNLDIVISADGTMACVVDGRQALIGTAANLHTALDTKAAGSGMDKSVNYKAARTALGGDRVATLYIEGAAVTGLMPTSSALPVPGLEGLIGQLPAWFIGGVRAEDDAVLLDFVSAPTPATTAGPSLVAIPATHPSVITPMLPGDTLVYVEAQGAGASLQNLLAELRQIPDVESALKMLDGIGGAGELVGWVDDVGLAITAHGKTPDGALLLVAKDEASAGSKLGALKSLLALAGSGNGIQVAESTVNGVAVTTVTITDAGALIPPGTIPGATNLPTGPISFSIAAHGRTLVVTSGESEMAAILNTAAGSSLADNASFKHALTRGLASARTTIYVGVGATVDLVKDFLSADELTVFTKDAAPYIEPFEGFLLQATSDAAGNRSRMVITVTQP